MHIGIDDDLDEPKEWQVYTKAFQPGNERLTRIGDAFQVTESAIPPKPSLLKLADHELSTAHERIEQQQVWDPYRLPQDALGKLRLQACQMSNLYDEMLIVTCFLQSSTLQT